MSDALSIAEIVEQDVELLPARTTLQTIEPGLGTVYEPGVVAHPPASADLAPPYVYDPAGAVPAPADLAPVHLPEPPELPAE